MKAGRRYQRQLWVAAAAISLVISGIGLCRLGPVGKKAGVIQFDVVIELSNTHIAWDHGLFDPSTVWLARYWVCQDYYAVSVVWTEPHGMGDTNIKTLAVLSDKDGFRINNGLFPDWVPTNTTYAKPLGQRGPFQWGGGPYEVAEMRFAEAEALSRRVYAGDLESLQAPGKSTGGSIDLKPGDNPDGARRKLAQLNVQAQAGRIESMDLLDGMRRKLVGIEYEYDHSGPVPQIARLTADLPVRPEKLAIDANDAITTRDGKIPYHYTDVDYVYHKGGRTSTVTYRDVTVGDVTLRLPVQVEVRRSDDKRPVRSAKLMNFKRVDLDKVAVWEAAKTYADYTTEDWQVNQMVNKLSDRKAGLGPLKVDPNDLSFARRLIAKCPIPERQPAPEPGMDPQARRKQIAEWRQRTENTPKPKRVTLELDDAILVRQLISYYYEKTSGLTEEEREKMRTGQLLGVDRAPPESQRELCQLRDELRDITLYHRMPAQPNRQGAEPTEADLDLIRQLQSRRESLAASPNATLGERLKAVDALWRLDLAMKNYDALERRTVLYLQMLRDADLPAMYMVGGYDGRIGRLIEVGQFDRAKRLLSQWMDRSVADNDADTVYRFCGWGLGGKKDPWVAVQLLDRFLKKPGLSPIERYEGLALRAISFDKMDKLLATPQEDLNAEGGKIGLVRWILSGTTRAEVARQADSAVRQALSAWQSLGTAKDNEAKPYSTIELDNRDREMLGYTADATRLQETSAQLDKIVRQRSAQRAQPQRSVQPPPARRSRPTR